LAGVTDNTNVVAITQPQPDQSVLDGVDVLILIDRQPPILRPHLPCDRIVGRQCADQHDHDVLEVDHAAVGFSLLIVGENAGELPGLQAEVSLDRRGRQGVLVQEIDPRPLDVGADVSNHRGVRGEIVRRQCRSHQARFARQQVGECPVGHPRPEVAQLTQSGGVKCPGLHALDAEVA